MRNKHAHEKSIIAFALMLFFVTPTFCQKYKEKDDVIYLDKQVIGKVSGEATFKTALTIYGLNGEEVLTIKPNVFPSNNPFLDDIYWYSIRFSDTGKIAILRYYGLCKTRCLLNKVIAHYDINLDGGFIKNQDEVIKKYNFSEEIDKDTTAISIKHKQMISLLKNNRILRGTDQPPLVFRQSETIQANTTTTVFSIAQDNIILGRIVKTRDLSTASITEHYVVYEKLYQPEGDIVEVPACRVTSMFTNIEFYTTVDNKKHVILVMDRTQVIDIPKALGSYLVANGYL